MMQVSQIVIYPIKSCAPIYLSSCRLAETGLEGDRIYVIAANRNGWEMISQRTHGQMCFIEPSYDSNNNLVINDEFTVNPPENTKSVEIKIWDDLVAGFDQGDEVSVWITEFLNSPQPLRLFKKDTKLPRMLPTKHTPSMSMFTYIPTTGFSDSAPILLLSEESVHDIQTRQTRDITFLNFRPNILFKGALFPFEEDSFMRISIGNTAFIVSNLCTRCTLITNDPQTGVKGPEPLRTLQRYRRIDPGCRGRPCVGVFIISQALETVSVGDRVTVIERGVHDQRGIWNGRKFGYIGGNVLLPGLLTGFMVAIAVIVMIIKRKS